MHKRTVVALLLLAFAGGASGQDVAPDTLFVRVVDTGPGLCCIAKIPTGNVSDPWAFVVYDAGNYPLAARNVTMSNIEEITGTDNVIDYLILSHTDSDHNGAVPRICDKFHVKTIVHSGYDRPEMSMTTQLAVEWIGKEVNFDGAVEVNLARDGNLEGRSDQVGKARLTFVCGFSTPPDDFQTNTPAEFNNAGSICVKLTYKRRSVFLAGDAVGRHIDDPADSLIATERFMVENADEVPLRADVLVAPHHGADNGSSTAFIQAVKPVWVIFSSGHAYSHPRLSTVNRYRAFGVADDHMLRTDRGDDESGTKDWASTAPGGDEIGRDDIDVTIAPNPAGATKAGIVAVKYRQPQS